MIRQGRATRQLTPVPEEFRGFPSLEVRSFQDLMARDLPPVRWVVPRILPEGVTLLAGKAKTRKSWLALGLCITVAAGGHALGRIQVEQGESLYAALEDNERRLQSRGRKILGRGVHAPPGFHYATSWPRLDEGGVQALAEWLGEHPDCRLIVLDTLAKVRPRHRNSSGGSYQEDYEALEELLPLAAERHVALIVVCHTRKASATDILDEINATTGLQGGVDGMLIFRTERGKNEATMYVDGRDIEEPGELALRWDRELHGWLLVGDAEETRLTEQRRAILDALRAAGEPMGPKALAKATGLNYGSVRNNLGALAVDGRIETVGRGAWQLAGVPQDSLSSPKFTDDNANDKFGDRNPDTYHQNPSVVTNVIDVTQHHLPNLSRASDDNDDNDDKGGNFPANPDKPLVTEFVIGANDNDNGGGGHAWHCDCPECL